jgi:HEAT repeat protein
MRKRIQAGVVVLVVVVVGVSWWQVLREREPSYKGKALSYWLDPLDRGQKRYRTPEEVSGALVAMGDPAITLLAHRLHWKPHPVMEFLHDRLPRFPFLAPYLRGRWDSQASAAHALGLLGPLAEKAVPDLDALEARRGLPPSCRRSVRFALVRIKQESLEPYIEKLKGASVSRVWYENAWILGQCGTNAAAAIPSLLAGLEPTNGPFIQMCACEAVGMIHSRPEVCVPALVPLLKSRDVNLRATAFIALGRFGSAAKPAWSELNECLHDQEAWVRRNATNLLRQIDAEAAPKSGVN